MLLSFEVKFKDISLVFIISFASLVRVKIFTPEFWLLKASLESSFIPLIIGKLEVCLKKASFYSLLFLKINLIS
jgi:hypothetical protein